MDKTDKVNITIDLGICEILLVGCFILFFGTPDLHDKLIGNCDNITIESNDLLLVIEKEVK